MVEAASILIVDDQATVRDMLEGLLSDEAAYRIELAENGEQALHRLQEQPIDLVLCDVMMPSVDGLAVCRAIKAHAAWRYIPVILITSLDRPDDQERGLEAGADEFISKPVHGVVLKARVRSMLRIRKQYAEARAEQPLDLEALMRMRRDRLADEAELSSRERQVLELLLLGRSSADIGQVLQISPRTARFHQENLLKKLGAESRLDLTRLFA